MASPPDVHAPPGRSATFAAIFEAYFPQIHRYIAMRLDADAAEDLAAETFAIAFRRWDSFDPDRGATRSWLFGIATNLIARHRRQEARAYRALERLGADPSRGVHEDRVTDRISAGELRPRLAGALASLSPRLRDVLLLVILGELTYEEVAQALDVPYGTVCSRFNRARARVRKALGETNPLLDEWS
ncbi:RNA polymerase sigma factor [Actinoallomurus vinaceus]|uniref:RNA polymerase sigma factor n=1 Tax=Actinoallomurus vinaceus TaxID=1080074 RepID=A0ABP8UHQ9_9ACTN